MRRRWVPLYAGWHCWLVQQCHGTIGSMSNGHRKRVKHYDEPGHCHELTFSCYRRMSLLTNDSWRELFCQALDRAIERQQYQLFAFVIMPDDSPNPQHPTVQHLHPEILDEGTPISFVRHRAKQF